MEGCTLIKDLKAGMSNITIQGIILDIKEIKSIKSSISYFVFVVADITGKIKCKVWF